jgi:hypothetical protein
MAMESSDNMSASTLAVAAVQIPVSRLVQVPGALIRILGEAGVGGRSLEQAFANEIFVSCVGCGIRLTVAELWSLSSGIGGPVTPKLRRVQLGACARNSCTCQFYLLSVPDSVGIQSTLVVHQVSALLASPEGLKDPALVPGDQSPPPRRVNYNVQLGKWALAFLAAVAVLVAGVRWWQKGAFIPGLSPKPRTFMPVEDTPLNPPTGRHAPDDAAEFRKAPRVFPVQGP